jgi:hypothetical protein
MTQAVTVRRDGDTFQARMFWRYAARLLDPQGSIIRVGFESGPKSFDDIWLEFDPSRSPSDQYGNPLRKEHIQCKWHVTPDQYGYSHLIDPEFINANARSLLQRAWDAQQNFAPAGTGVRFKLLTNWRIERTDPLRKIISTRSGALRLERLFGTATDKSAVGAVRKVWREHLEIDEDELRLFAPTLSFGEATDSLDCIRDELDILFGYVGLRRIPANETAFPYDNLVFEWMAQGKQEFDRQSFRKACDQQGLLSQGSSRPLVFGVKSFEHPLDRLQDRCIDVLDFVPDFDERYIRSDADWSAKLYPTLKNFLITSASNANPLRLALDAHTTLAFAAGSVLNIKSGRNIQIEQRTLERKIWMAGDEARNNAWAEWIFDVEILDENALDIAVAISLTHDVAHDVKSYLSDSIPLVGKLLMARPVDGPGARTVVCGQHAFELAESLVGRINAERTKGRHPLHIFIAAPNTFTFFFGQRQHGLGKVTLYEYDFEGSNGGSYSASLSLPI